MYIPKSKQIVGKKIEGTLVDPATGRQYNGKFVQDYLGNFYKGESITSDSKPLEYVPPATDVEKEKYYSEFITEFPKPTEADYKTGKFTRYFLQDLRNKKIVELERKTYLVRFEEPPAIYRKLYKLDWLITGEPEDILIKGYLYQGIKSKNKKIIEEAEKEMPGIKSQILKDPGQFVRK